MAQGWISIHRQLQSHWLWEDKPFSRGQAWVDILMLANHDDKKFLLGNELVEVKCGSFITSIAKLCEKWGWSNTKVVKFLDLLENDGMLIRKSDTKKTLITIENYGVYQVPNDTKTTQKHTNNNDNNDNNDNNTIIYSENASLNETIIAYVEYRKGIKKPMSEHAVKLMINKLNKLSPDVHTQIEILNQSIMNGWQGIFPLKQEQQVKPATKRNGFNNFTGRGYTRDEIGAMERLLHQQRHPATTVDDDADLKAEADELQRKMQEKYAKSV